MFSPSLDRHNCHSTWASLFAFTALIAIAPSAHSEQAAATAAPKEFTLFLGGNLEAPYGKEFYPVRHVSQDELEIEVNKASKRLSLEDVREFRVQREAKLASVSATIAIVHCERTQVSTAKAELEALSRGVALQNDMQDRLNIASGKMMRESLTAGSSSTSGAPGSGPSDKDGLNAATDKMSQASASSDLSDMKFASKRAAELAAEDSCDALALELQISSPKPLSQAHIVVVSEFHAAGNPAETRGVITAKYVGKVGSKPVKITLEQQGFPAGYILGKEHLFLYENGAEIATNLSDDRRELTRDETFRYLLVQYIASHGKATRPPTPVMGALPSNFREKVTPSQLDKTISITVNKNGEITEITNADASAANLSPVIETALRNYRFYPALENGLPTEGKMTLKLADLLR